MSIEKIPEKTIWRCDRAGCMASTDSKPGFVPCGWNQIFFSDTLSPKHLCPACSKAIFEPKKPDEAKAGTPPPEPTEDDWAAKEAAGFVAPVTSGPGQFVIGCLIFQHRIRPDPQDIQVVRSCVAALLRRVVAERCPKKIQPERTRMLVFERRPGDKFVIDIPPSDVPQRIEIAVVGMRSGERVRVGVEAPKHIRIVRDDAGGVKRATCGPNGQRFLPSHGGTEAA